MAANLLTVGSKFQPFSYAELIAPLQAYQEEYDKQEELYNQYAETAGTIGSQLNPEYDKDIIENVFNPYMQEISKNADILAKQGLSADTRRNLQALRRRFGESITPIKLAADARAKARDNWDKMLAQDKTTMTTANPYYQGITAYMNGASPETAYASGTELYGRGKSLAEAFSKTMRDVPSVERNALYGQYFAIEKQYGATSKEMQNFMMNMVNAIPALGNQIESILNNSGIGQDSKFSDIDKNKAYQYVLEGMKAGLSGTSDVQYLQNKQFEYDMRRALKMASDEEVKRKLFYTLGEGELSSRDQELHDKYNEDIKTLSKYINPDGSNKEILQAVKPWYGDTIESMSYVPGKPSINKNSEFTTANPEYTLYQDYAKKYGTDNIQEIVNLMTNDVRKLQQNNRYYYMNTTDTSNIIEDVLPAITAGINMDKDKQSKTVIWKDKGGKHKPVDVESIKEFLNQDNIRMSINPGTGKAKFTDGIDSLYVDPERLLSTLMLTLDDGSQISGNKYIKGIIDSMGNFNSDNPQDINSLNIAMNYLYSQLWSRANDRREKQSETASWDKLYE